MTDAMTELESLYRLHASALLRYLRRIEPRPGEAEDLLHETFVQAAVHWPRVCEADSKRAWLFGAARNIAGGARRRLRRWTSAPLPNVVPERAAQPADPRGDIVRSELRALSAKHREALEMRLRDDLSYAEIAEALGLPLGTVRSRIHYAVARLGQAVRAALSASGSDV